jgi:hypothetical protein
MSDLTLDHSHRSAPLATVQHNLAAAMQLTVAQSFVSDTNRTLGLSEADTPSSCVRFALGRWDRTTCLGDGCPDVVAVLDRDRRREQPGAICDPTHMEVGLSGRAQPVSVSVLWRRRSPRVAGWLTLAADSGQALRALDAWRDQRRGLEIELSWLLDESA